MSVPKIDLIQAPTPLHRLDRMSDKLGIDLWIKRDDLTGFALGGNKGRKLEYLMADVMASGAEVVVTNGSSHSNFVRMVAVACAMLGLGCVALVMDTPYEYEPSGPSATEPNFTEGNAYLARLAGADLRWLPDGTWDSLFERWEQVAQELESTGMRVYRMPLGGSTPLGAYGFYQATNEIRAQVSKEFDSIVFGSSSGSTQVGLHMGFVGSKTKVIGILCDPEPEISHDFAKLGAGVAEVAGAPAPKAEDFTIEYGYVGPGYGVPSDEGQATIRELAQREGIFLDPVYSAKAFAGLIDLANKGKLGGRVLFWHTGGIPSLFVPNLQ